MHRNLQITDERESSPGTMQPHCKRRAGAAEDRRGLRRVQFFPGDEQDRLAIAICQSRQAGQ